jgi:hypothetical protein
MQYKFEAVDNYDEGCTQLFLHDKLLLATIPWYTYRVTALFIHPANIAMLTLPSDSYIKPTPSEQTPILTMDELVKVVTIVQEKRDRLLDHPPGRRASA